MCQDVEMVVRVRNVRVVKMSDVLLAAGRPLTIDDSIVHLEERYRYR
jgi:hypothetical protein